MSRLAGHIGRISYDTMRGGEELVKIGLGGGGTGRLLCN